MAHLERIYDDYWSENGYRPPPNDNPFLRQQISKLCAPGMSIADFGCGDGSTIGDAARRNGAEYLGMDISETGLMSAKQRGLNVLKVDNLASNDLPPSAFDAVFIIEVLEHLFDPLATVQEARRVLRPNGTLVVTVPNCAVWLRRAELTFTGRTHAMGDDLSRSQPWRDPHIRLFTISSLRNMLSIAGFHNVNVGGTEAVAPGLGERIGATLVRVRPSLFARRCTATANP